MNFTILIFLTFISTIIHITQQIPFKNSLSILKPLKREIRYSKIDFYFENSTGTILESGFKNYLEKQLLNYHFIVYKKLDNFQVRFHVNKCKEYYIDCVNVISYDVFDACSKLTAVTYFVRNNNIPMQFKCPISGEITIKNMSIDAETFGSMFGLPTESWWEYYWKTSAIIIGADKKEIATFSGEFYFIQYRPRIQNT